MSSSTPSCPMDSGGSARVCGSQKRFFVPLLGKLLEKRASIQKRAASLCQIFSLYNTANWTESLRPTTVLALQFDNLPVLVFIWFDTPTLINIAQFDRGGWINFCKFDTFHSSRSIYGPNRTFAPFCVHTQREQSSTASC